MTDRELRQTIKDAALYATDARKAARFKLEPAQLTTVASRLRAARGRIEKALNEIYGRAREMNAELGVTECNCGLPPHLCVYPTCGAGNEIKRRLDESKQHAEYD